MRMQDLAQSVDKFLNFNEYKILEDKGKPNDTKITLLKNLLNNDFIIKK